MLTNEIDRCPCGSGETYNDCCGSFISYSRYPEKPKQLMRSRYSAYILKNEDYLLKSWHESTRPESLDLKADSTQWKKLKIISASESKVIFVAFFTQDTLNNEKKYALTESSNFVKDDHWQYIDGDEVKTIQLTKNMSCPCQSGKKYKRCCEVDLNN